MSKDPIFELCDVVRKTSFELHKYLKHGHRELVYQRGLAHRLSKLGLTVQQQYETSVFDEDGTYLGSFPADLAIEGKLLVELKAVSRLVPEHTAQIIGYLQASKIDHGLLINFGAHHLEIKKYIAPRCLDKAFDVVREELCGAYRSSLNTTPWQLN